MVQVSGKFSTAAEVGTLTTIHPSMPAVLRDLSGNRDLKLLGYMISNSWGHPECGSARSVLIRPVQQLRAEPFGPFSLRVIASRNPLVPNDR